MCQPTCPDHPEVELVYDGHYGAPGIGYAAHCPVDGRDFSVVGDTVHNPEDMAHIMSPEDVI